MDPRLEHRAAPDAPALLRPGRPPGWGRSPWRRSSIAICTRRTAAPAVSDRGRASTAFPNFAPRARRVIYLFQSGAPSQMDLFDPKPGLERLQGTDLPDSIRMGQRLTGMTSRQDRFPVAASRFAFARHGQSGAAVSASFCRSRRGWPTSSASSSRCTPRRSTTTRPSPSSRPGPSLPGGPSIGSWVAYGLGSENQDLPAFVVMISRGSGNPNDQPLYDRLWGSGFLPTTYQGIKFRSVGDPVLYLSNPAGLSAAARRRTLDDLGKLDAHQSPRVRRPGDPHPDRPVRDGVPDADLGPRADRPVGRARIRSSTLYGPDVAHAREPIAANCLLARRLAERGVRFIQLFHRGWDQHTHLPNQIAGQCRDTDQAVRGPGRRPQAARAAGRHPGRLGRRVRPDRLLPGPADRPRLRPRPPSPLLHDLAGRRRHQARNHPRRDRRLRLQHQRRTRCTSMTCTPRSCIAWASTTPN